MFSVQLFLFALYLWSIVTLIVEVRSYWLLLHDDVKARSDVSISASSPKIEAYSFSKSFEEKWNPEITMQFASVSPFLIDLIG